MYLFFFELMHIKYHTRVWLIVFVVLGPGMQEKRNPDEAPTDPAPLKDAGSPSPSPIHAMQPLTDSCELRRAVPLSKSESSLVEAEAETLFDEEDGEEEGKTDDEEVELYQDNETVQIMSDDKDCVMSPPKEKPVETQPVETQPPINIYDFQDTLMLDDSQVYPGLPMELSPELVKTGGGEQAEPKGLKKEVETKDEEQKVSAFEKVQEELFSDDDGNEGKKTTFKVGDQYYYCDDRYFSLLAYETQIRNNLCMTN